MKCMKNTLTIDDNTVYIRFIIPMSYRKCYVIGVTMVDDKKGANVCLSKSTGLYYAAPGSHTAQKKDTKYYDTDYGAAFYYHVK